MSLDVSFTSATLNLIGLLTCPSGLMTTISPGNKSVHSPAVEQKWPCPSSIKTLLGAPLFASQRAVPPVTAQVNPALRMCAAAPFAGTDTRIAPPPRVSSRPASLKLNTVLAPRRVMVRSINVSSARESVPVRTAVPLPMASLTLAGRGAACAGSNCTSLMTCVTRADFVWAAFASGATITEQTANHSRATDLDSARVRWILVIKNRRVPMPAIFESPSLDRRRMN